jgi:outer membrane protein assembly factor BamB
MRWQGTALALLTLGKGKIAAYDWSTGSRLWETKAKVRPKSFAYDSGGYIVLIDAEKKVGDDLRPPYRVTVVNGKTGKIVWAKKDLGGKKIVNYSFAVPGQIRLVSKKEVVANLNVADGGAAAAPAGVENQRFVEYSRGSKTLICRDFVGNVAWTREDEISERASFTVKKDYVVWPTKRGIVEVISLSDGMLRWRSDFEESPRPFLNEAGTYLVVQGKEDVTIVKMVD